MNLSLYFSRRPKGTLQRVEEMTSSMAMPLGPVVPPKKKKKARLVERFSR